MTSSLPNIVYYQLEKWTNSSAFPCLWGKEKSFSLMVGYVEKEAHRSYNGANRSHSGYMVTLTNGCFILLF